MLTGELRNQVDTVWNSFWSGGIANPLMLILYFKVRHASMGPVRLIVIGALLSVASLLVSPPLMAETIWCEKLKIGCRAAQETEKKRRDCERVSRGSYQRELQWAINNEWSDEGWRINGWDSAYDQAKAHVEGLYISCLKTSGIYKDIYKK